MAEIVGAVYVGHSPFACYTPAERWKVLGARRKLRADVPVDTEAVNMAKAERIRSAFDTLKGQLAEMRPDALIIFGDDQLEAFDFTNFPGVAIYVGSEFSGYVMPLQTRTPEEEKQEMAVVKCSEELATAVLTGVMKRGFDPAFVMEPPKPAVGLGHAIMPPLSSLTNLDVPTVPILLNCYYAPQITGWRAWALGRAVADAVEEAPGNMRVCVIGSGGLWHTPMMADAYLDEDFDRRMLELLSEGRGADMAKFFDEYVAPADDLSQREDGPSHGRTGLPGAPGPQGGTREWCNWLAAVGATEGRPVQILDYVPVYASPVGIGFASSLGGVGGGPVGSGGRTT